MKSLYVLFYVAAFAVFFNLDFNDGQVRKDGLLYSGTTQDDIRVVSREIVDNHNLFIATKDNVADEWYDNKYHYLKKEISAAVKEAVECNMSVDEAVHFINANIPSTLHVVLKQNRTTFKKEKLIK